MALLPMVPMTMQPMEARYIAVSGSTASTSPTRREKRRLTMTAAYMALMPPT